MADQETIPIGLETQNKVAEAIYLRWYSNGARHPRPWNEMPMEGKEPWRRVAKDAIRTFFGSPEFQNLLDDVYDEGYDDATRQDIFNQVMREGTCQKCNNVPAHVKDIFVVSQDINAEEHVRMQAVLQALAQHTGARLR